MTKSWENKPWVWFAIVVGAGVTTAIVSNALSKWWGLMKLQDYNAKNILPAQVSGQANLGKYRIVSN